jgi:hypothetical protein
MPFTQQDIHETIPPDTNWRPSHYTHHKSRLPLPLEYSGTGHQPPVWLDPASSQVHQKETNADFEVAAPINTQKQYNFAAIAIVATELPPLVKCHNSYWCR